LYKIEERLRKTGSLSDEDIMEIDEIRGFAWGNREFPESEYLLNKANEILLRHYKNKLDREVEEIYRKGRKIDKKTMIDFGSLQYIIDHLKDKKIDELKCEAHRYAQKVVDAGNRLAIALGISPLR